jgi:hypothetical protein
MPFLCPRRMSFCQGTIQLAIYQSSIAPILRELEARRAMPYQTYWDHLSSSCWCCWQITIPIEFSMALWDEWTLSKDWQDAAMTPSSHRVSCQGCLHSWVKPEAKKSAVQWATGRLPHAVRQFPCHSIYFPQNSQKTEIGTRCYKTFEQSVQLKALEWKTRNLLAQRIWMNCSPRTSYKDLYRMIWSYLIWHRSVQIFGATDFRSLKSPWFEATAHVSPPLRLDLANMVTSSPSYCQPLKDNVWKKLWIK